MLGLRAAARATAIKVLAEGMSYQTLIASILHKYAAGRLADKEPSAMTVQRREAQLSATAKLLACAMGQYSRNTAWVI